MKEYIKKFESASSTDGYVIADIPFATSVATDPIQNLVCNLTGKKLVSVGGIIEVQSSGPEMVDLGLTSGTLWAKYNIGATGGSTPESLYGAYYAWAETDEKSGYSWSTYKYANGDSNKLTKYCPSDKTDYWGGTGSPDNKIELDATDDIATQAYGSNYRMPTKAELEELIALPNKWTIVNGVKGRVFVSASQTGVSAGDFSIADTKLYFYDAAQDFEIVASDYVSANALKYVTTIDELNDILTDTFVYSDYEGQADVTTMLFKDKDHKIPVVAGTDYTFGSFPTFDSSNMLFIPAAGHLIGSSNLSGGSYCYLWSSFLNLDHPDYAHCLFFHSTDISASRNNRCNGFPVRAIGV